MFALTDLVNLIRKHTNLLFVFILPVYFYIVQNSIQNKHTHVYANGIIVTHSHPGTNNNGPLNDHKHTQSEICLFASLHFDLYETPVFTEFNFEVPEIHNEYVVVDEQELKKQFVPHLIPRAPPV